MTEDMKVKRGRKALPPDRRKQMFSFRMNPMLRKRLSDVSLRTGRPMAYLIEVSLQEFLNKIKLPNDENGTNP